MPVLQNNQQDDFRKEMFQQINLLKNKTYCSVINTLIELKVTFLIQTPVLTICLAFYQ
jgi:hypothetical protein